MINRTTLGLLLLSIGGLGCVPPTDDPSQVKDLRVLAVNFDPPELMAIPPPGSSCFSLFGAGDAGVNLAPFAAFAGQIEMTWLIMDPKGANRPIGYEVRACAHQDDLKCENEGDFVVLASGSTRPAADGGGLTLPLTPGRERLDIPPDGGPFSGTPLLLEVVSQDPYRGSGGFRMPIVIKLTAGTEVTYAQKLMVFSCRVFPEMKANLNPALPGMTYTTHQSRSVGADDGGVWGENDVPQFAGKDGGIRFEPLPFTEQQESYVVPSFELKPLSLVESWKISWHTDLGRISPNQTGGVGFDGIEEKHRVFWSPLIAENTERDVNFWMVVRDGRGGQTWIHRKLHWTP